MIFTVMAILFGFSIVPAFAETRTDYSKDGAGEYAWPASAKDLSGRPVVQTVPSYLMSEHDVPDEYKKFQFSTGAYSANRLLLKGKWKWVSPVNYNVMGVKGGWEPISSDAYVLLPRIGSWVDADGLRHIIDARIEIVDRTPEQIASTEKECRAVGGYIAVEEGNVVGIGTRTGNVGSCGSFNTWTDYWFGLEIKVSFYYTGTDLLVPSSFKGSTAIPLPCNRRTEGAYFVSGFDGLYQPFERYPDGEPIWGRFDRDGWSTRGGVDFDRTWIYGSDGSAPPSVRVESLRQWGQSKTMVATFSGPSFNLRYGAFDGPFVTYFDNLNSSSQLVKRIGAIAVDESGIVLKDKWIVKSGMSANDEWSVDPPSIDGYEYVGLAEGSAPLTGRIVDGDSNEQTITMTYRNTGDISVWGQAVDEDGNVLRPQWLVESGLSMGDSWSVDPPSIDGYEYVGLAEGSAPLNGTVTDASASDLTVNMEYRHLKRIQAQVVDTEGNTVIEPWVVGEDLKNGDTWEIQPQKARYEEMGYEYVGLAEGSAPLSGGIVNNSPACQTVTLVVRKKREVIVRGILNDGTELFSRIVGKGLQISDTWNYKPDSHPFITNPNNINQSAWFRYAGLAEGSAPLTGEIMKDSPLTTTIVIIYKAVVDIEAQAYDADHPDIALDTSHTISTDLDFGDKWEVDPPEFPGYGFVEASSDSAPLSGIVGWNTEMETYRDGNTKGSVYKVKLLYRRHTIKTVKARCIDEQGNLLREEWVVATGPDEDGSYGNAVWNMDSIPTINQYKYVGLAEGSTPLSGRITASSPSEQIITLKYESNVKITVRYVIAYDLSSGPFYVDIVEREILALKRGDSWSVNAPREITSSNGRKYRFSRIPSQSAPLTGTVNENTPESQEVLLIYTPPSQVVASYIDADTGKDLKPYHVIYDSLYPGDSYEVKPPEIKGYRYVGLGKDSDSISGIMQHEGNRNVVLAYRQPSIQIRYVVKNAGQTEEVKPAETFAKGLSNGDTWNVEPPATIESYGQKFKYVGPSDDSAPLTGIMSEDTPIIQTVTIIYSPPISVIVACIKDENLQSTLIDPWSVDGEFYIGSTYKIEPPKINGYRYAGTIGTTMGDIEYPDNPTNGAITDRGLIYGSMYFVILNYTEINDSAKTLMPTTGDTGSILRIGIIVMVCAMLSAVVWNLHRRILSTSNRAE
ncbi:LPXTG-domain-containing protein cell wall anchor domain [Bifidobacterium saguini DSM 23967]|uniref:LPXTG-domain-containing protein cell wall anchor domain n=1 Tax=Bifidobacterium saguini DSM 23967 TaxID=1437607 RepID=A0A087D3Z6_9BIFI|nr:LPXTG-domain-containing protein cell wall anchor domain [Bifidobacterium saguini DSM 23967]